MLAWLDTPKKEADTPNEPPNYAPVLRQLSRVLDEAQALIPDEYRGG
jgi:hypothetical protein